MKPSKAIVPPKPKSEATPPPRKVVRLLLREYNLVEGYTPPPLDIVLVDEDEDYFYGWPANFDATMIKLTFGSKKIGLYRKKPNKKDPSYWELTWRKSKQEQA